MSILSKDFLCFYSYSNSAWSSKSTKWGHTSNEDQKKLYRKQQFWEWSELGFDVLCLVVIVLWERFIKHLQVFEDLNLVFSICCCQTTDKSPVFKV